MKMKVMYCKRSRKDGTFNTVAFDTDAKTYSNRSEGVDCVFVEAQMSRDVDGLRDALSEQGYRLVPAV